MFKKYKRVQEAEIRPLTNEDFEQFKQYGCIYTNDNGTKVSISDTDLDNGSPKVGDMIARNPRDNSKQWLIAKDCFETSFTKIPEEFILVGENTGTLEKLGPRGRSASGGIKYQKSNTVHITIKFKDEEYTYVVGEDSQVRVVRDFVKPVKDLIVGDYICGYLITKVEHNSDLVRPVYNSKNRKDSVFLMKGDSFIEVFPCGYKTTI